MRIVTSGVDEAPRPSRPTSETDLNISTPRRFSPLGIFAVTLAMLGGLLGALPPVEAAGALAGVSLAPPTVTIESGPATGSFVQIPGSATNSTVTVDFTFRGSPGTTQFLCSINGSAYTTCDDATPGNDFGSKSVTLGSGIHTFQVKAGNADGEFTEDCVGQTTPCTPLVPRRQWTNTLIGDTFVDDSGDDARNCRDPQQPCRTVARGVASAQAARTVFVDGGTYPENVQIGDGKSLRSLNGAGATKIRTVRVLDTGAVRIDGFALLGGTDPADSSKNVPLVINGPTSTVRAISFNTETAQQVPADLVIDATTGSGAAALQISANNFTDDANAKVKPAIAVRNYPGSILIGSNQFHSYETAIEAHRRTPTRRLRQPFATTSFAELSVVRCPSRPQVPRPTGPTWSSMATRYGSPVQPTPSAS